MKTHDDKLLESLKTQSQRRKRYEQRTSLWRQTIFTGTLGLMFILPLIGGAYLGRWLDEKLNGYSISWTLNLILLGVAFGAFNCYLYIKERK